tara:strand:- start:2593 stop:2784 length:192 start_codon:yes stop_codon:yes gene_type:complete
MTQNNPSISSKSSSKTVKIYKVKRGEYDTTPTYVASFKSVKNAFKRMSKLEKEGYVTMIERIK